jgi:hypothetical protein
VVKGWNGELGAVAGCPARLNCSHDTVETHRVRLSFFFLPMADSAICGARSGVVGASPQTDWLRRVSFFCAVVVASVLRRRTFIPLLASTTISTNLAGWENSKRPRRLGAAGDQLLFVS